MCMLIYALLWPLFIHNICISVREFSTGLKCKATSNLLK